MNIPLSDTRVNHFFNTLRSGDLTLRKIADTKLLITLYNGSTRICVGIIPKTYMRHTVLAAPPTTRKMKVRGNKGKEPSKVAERAVQNRRRTVGLVKSMTLNVKS